MPRAIWKGNIAFGLVNIPVSLYSGESKPDVQLHMVDSRNHARIRYERVNAETGEEVPWESMVRGYEYEDGHYVLLSDKELEAVEPKLTKTIEIADFVSLVEIDPMLFDKPYLLEPDKRGKKAYALLRSTLAKTGKAGVARVVIRTREYLSTVFVRGEVLVLMLLRFPQELTSITKLELPDSKAEEYKPKPREIELAIRLVDEMSLQWDPKRYHDEYRGALMDYIEKKVDSGDTSTDVSAGEEEEESTSGKVVDLLDYLQRSVKGGSKNPTKVAEKKSSVKKAAAKPVAKKAAKKSARKTVKKHAATKSTQAKRKRSA